jgi:hypothetical protein
LENIKPSDDISVIIWIEIQTFLTILMFAGKSFSEALILESVNLQ